jgi:dTMP kinase
MFITLEGVEGSGKTTAQDSIRRFFEDRGYSCVMTREPGGTEFGRKLRQLLLDPVNRDIAPLAELLLYVADRAQHVREVIQPALAQGAVVVSDRFMDATVVYQGMARGLGAERVGQLHRLVLGEMVPDLTLLFDLPVDVGLARAWQDLVQGARPEDESRFEQEAMTFHERVRQGYLALARQSPQRFRIIDAAAAVDAVQHQVVQVLEAALPPTASPRGAVRPSRPKP